MPSDAPDRTEPTSERALSVRAFARRFDISDKTVRALIHAGQVKALRVGPRLLRIPASEVEAFARRSREGGEATGAEHVG